MNYEVGRVYKIKKSTKIAWKDTYIWIVGMDGEGNNKRLKFNYIDDIGREALIYYSDMGEYSIEKVS